MVEKATKVTFTVDADTVHRLRRIATRLGRPQSQVVREAIREYEARSTRLSDAERARMVAVVDRMLASPPTRSVRAVEAELRDLRARRRRWAHPSRA